MKEKMKGKKGARTGCIKKPGGKKLPACGAKLFLRQVKKATRCKPGADRGILMAVGIGGGGCMVVMVNSWGGVP
jgi:hypothetical protein